MRGKELGHCWHSQWYYQGYMVILRICVCWSVIIPLGACICLAMGAESNQTRNALGGISTIGGNLCSGANSSLQVRPYLMRRTWTFRYCLGVSACIGLTCLCWVIGCWIFQSFLVWRLLVWHLPHKPIQFMQLTLLGVNVPWAGRGNLNIGRECVELYGGVDNCIMARILLAVVCALFMRDTQSERHKLFSGTECTSALQHNSLNRLWRFEYTETRI